MTQPSRPITLTIAALGGQGGGVVADWLIAVAQSEKYLVQATSVPGVAQRTGATIYYLEFFPESALPADGRKPVMALMPNPGDVDVVVASELVEAGRVIQRGLVTKDRTTLIASTHRAYTVSEKSNLGDGRADAATIMDEAQRLAQRFVAFDMAELAERHGAVISSVILGAIAGAARLPFAHDAYREAIRAGGIAVETNLAAFDASCELARTSDVFGMHGSAKQAMPHAPAIPASLGSRVDGFPAAARTTVAHGVARLIDYQDEPYATLYLDRLQRIASLEANDKPGARLPVAVARALALGMSFPDTLRVAQLKTRPERAAAIASRLRVKSTQLTEVTEFVRPRVDEICGTLPANLGRKLLASPTWRKRIERHTSGRELRTSTITGFAFLKALSGMRRWRRGTLRYAEEHARIEQWLAEVAALARVDYDLAVELAKCQQLVRGYGDTHERGWQNYQRILAAARALAGRSDAATTVDRLRRAAAQDERGTFLERELAALDAAAQAA
jgi:indolepyruvate ferredoxin oxidoreductase beta subunit